MQTIFKYKTMKKLLYLTMLFISALAWAQQTNIQYIINTRTGKFDAVRPLSTIGRIAHDSIAASSIGNFLPLTLKQNTIVNGTSTHYNLTLGGTNNLGNFTVNYNGDAAIQGLNGQLSLSGSGGVLQFALGSGNIFQDYNSPGAGIQYYEDYRSGYTDRSLPDWGNVKYYTDSKLGASIVAKATIILTAAQVSNNTYVLIIPAPGANKMIVPIYVDAVLNWLPGNTAYTADYFWLTFSYDGANSQLSATFPSGMNSILGITAKNIAFSFTIAELTGSSVATYPNAPLYIQNHNTVTSPGNSTLTVDVCYIVVDI